MEAPSASPHLGYQPATGRPRDGSASATSAASRAVRLGRRVTSAPLPKRLDALRSGPKKFAWTCIEARLVTTPVRYAVRELVSSGRADYTLRHSGGRISLRHQSGDIDIFRKFYAYDYYRWPQEVVAQLRALGRPVNVLDLGGNIGFFEVHAQEQLALGSVIAFEPDPANGDVWERVRDANRADWSIVRACAANENGTAMFKTGAHNFSRIDDSGEVPVETVDVFPYIANADLVKMNIEGSEWAILHDPRLLEVSPIWIVEYHRIANPTEEIHKLARAVFEDCGYATRLSAKTNGNGLLWAWKTPVDLDRINAARPAAAESA